jgi:hypothetical protein
VGEEELGGMGMLFTRSIEGVTGGRVRAVGKEDGGREVGRTICGAEIVASWPIDLICVKVLGDNMAQQARTVASLHKRAVYRARN